MEQAIKEILSKWRKRKLQLMKERRNYHTNHGHNWMISIIQEFEKDLKEFMSEI